MPLSELHYKEVSRACLQTLAAICLAGCHQVSALKPSAAPAGDEPESAREGCIIRRAAYDIGSATTKVKVAVIDRCKGKIVEVLFAGNAPLFFRDDVSGPVPHFKPATMDTCLLVLKNFVDKVASYRPAESAAVATSAFRLAKNGPAMVARVERELGIPVTIITQLQEARIGFVGAVLSSGTDPRQAIVWDVGGRSMQITSLQADGHMTIYQGQFASGQMRDYVIRNVKGMPATVHTPNPLSWAEVGAASAYAQSYAVEKVPAELREKLADDDAVVVGIGALKYYGDKSAKVRGAVVTPTGLRSEIDRLVGKSDGEIGGSYASTAVSDRILLAGFMEGLDIDAVQLVDVDLTDGLFFEPAYWRSPSRRTAGPAVNVTTPRSQLLTPLPTLSAQSSTPWLQCRSPVARAQCASFFRERWGTRVASSPFLASGPSSVPHIVLHR